MPFAVWEVTMEIMQCEKQAFAVIGKEGSTDDGAGFIGRLWNEANGHFTEVEALAKKDSTGCLAGIWGAMSDMARSNQPWEENFTKGLYLAGVECELEQEAPEGWTKWVIPAYKYLYVKCSENDVFQQMLDYLYQHNIPLAGAVLDFVCPKTGENYMFFPVKRL